MLSAGCRQFCRCQRGHSVRIQPDQPKLTCMPVQRIEGDTGPDGKRASSRCPQSANIASFDGLVCGRDLNYFPSTSRRDCRLNPTENLYSTSG